MKCHCFDVTWNMNLSRRTSSLWCQQFWLLWKLCTSRSVQEGFPSATNLVFFITHTTTKEFYLFLMSVAHLVLNTPHVLQPHLTSYTRSRSIHATAAQCCRMTVCCDTSAEWKTWQVIRNATWLSRNQTVATFSLHSASKCHSRLSWLMQATLLTVLWGISAQRRVLQAQSKMFSESYWYFFGK